MQNYFEFQCEKYIYIQKYLKNGKLKVCLTGKGNDRQIDNQTDR